MTQINPFSGAVVKAQTQQPQGIARQRQIRRAQNLSKNAALQGDRLEHEVESADALHGINDQGSSHNPQRRPQQGAHAARGREEDAGADAPHLDVRA